MEFPARTEVRAAVSSVCYGRPWRIVSMRYSDCMVRRGGYTAIVVVPWIRLGEWRMLNETLDVVPDTGGCDRGSCGVLGLFFGLPEQ